jgi:simple sugar transport system permease protein
MIDVLNYGSTIGILAIGMTPVIAMRGIDLSVGSVMALAACVAGMLSTSGHGGFVAVLGGIAVGGLCGLWNALLVAHFRIQPFVATLVLLVAARGIAQMVTSSQIVTFHDNVIEFIGLGRPPWMPLPFPFLLVTGLLALTLIALRCSALGLLIRAVGGNPEAARLAGVRAPSLIACSYVFCGLCAGIAGLIAAANIKAADPFNTGRNFELAAIFAVVVGGTPLAGGRLSLVGAFVGAMLMQCLTTTMYARNVSADVAPLPQALLILGVCIAGSPRVHGALRAWRSRSVP